MRDQGTANCGSYFASKCKGRRTFFMHADSQKGFSAGQTDKMPTADQMTPSVQKSKRPATFPHSQQRTVKPKTAEKGKITSFFTKNPA